MQSDFPSFQETAMGECKGKRGALPAAFVRGQRVRS